MTAYGITGPTTRHIEGTCDVDGRFGTYAADIDDQGEPGAGKDTLVLRVNGVVMSEPVLNGGNIQLHTCK